MQGEGASNCSELLRTCRTSLEHRRRSEDVPRSLNLRFFSFSWLTRLEDMPLMSAGDVRAEDEVVEDNLSE